MKIDHKTFFCRQIVFAVSVPIPYKNPLRKIFFNSGFQFNYNEPYAPSSFYNPTYFQDAFTGSRDLPSNAANSTDVQASELNAAGGSEAIEAGTTEAEEAERAATEEQPSVEDTEPPATEQSRGKKLQSRSLDSNELTGSDVSAGQLYESIERNLVE